MNNKYQTEYKKWFESLSAKEKSKLKMQGLDKPLDDNNKIFTPNYEAAFASIGEDFDYDKFDKKENLDDSDVAEKAKAYGSLLLCWVFQRLQSHKKMKDALVDRDALLFALGMDNLLAIKTQTELAKHYGVTRAAISFRVKEWQKLLGIKPSSLMKSEFACKAYKKARLVNLTQAQSLGSSLTKAWENSSEKKSSKFRS